LNVKIGHLCIKEKVIQFVNNADVLNNIDEENKESLPSIVAPEESIRVTNIESAKKPKAPFNPDKEYKRFLGSVT